MLAWVDEELGTGRHGCPPREQTGREGGRGGIFQWSRPTSASSTCRALKPNFLLLQLRLLAVLWQRVCDGLLHCSSSLAALRLAALAVRVEADSPMWTVPGIAMLACPVLVAFAFLAFAFSFSFSFVWGPPRPLISDL